MSDRTSFAWSATCWLTKWLFVSVLLAAAFLFLRAVFTETPDAESDKSSVIYQMSR